MIFGMLNEMDNYSSISPDLAKGFEAINDYTGYKPGKYEIDGNKIYLMVQDFQTLRDSVWEAHYDYLDIHYIVSGEERIGFAADITAFKTVTPYDSENDAVILSGNGSFADCPKGSFAVFMPREAHMPCLCIKDRDPAGVRKIVVKIKWGK